MTTDIRREVHYDGRMMRCFADRPATVAESFRRMAEALPGHAALVAGDVRLTYRQLDDQMERLAAGLSALGLKLGDRLGLLMGNRLEFVIAALAAARLGLVLVPLNVRHRRPELAFMLAQSGAAALIYDSGSAEELPERCALPALRHVIALDGIARPGHLSFADLMTAAPPTISGAIPAEEDAFCILYTSGTTGQPKGAILTHLGIVHSLEHYRRTFELGSSDVSALAVPASHVTGLVALVLSTLHSGGTLCLMESFRARDFLALVEDERITYTLMVPAMYNLCLLCPDLTQFDLSSWRAGGFGGAPMPETTITHLHKAIAGLALSNVYGATETTSPATFLPGSDALSHSGSVGRVLPCADIVVTDDAGREVPAGTRGELLIGGPMVIPGYWDNDEANSKSFVGGYWRSGDIGSMDADGYLVIHDRLKDVVNRGGYKIYCIEVESVIAQFPGVIECAVVGVSDEVMGERACAFVNGETADEEALRRHCTAQLADYKVPEAFIFAEEPLPRNANGKVVKSILRDRAIATINARPRAKRTR